MDDVKGRRTEVLLRWLGVLEAEGRTPLPTRADLRDVGAAGRCWPPQVDRTVLEPWRAQVEFLIRRVAAGASDPVRELRASPLGRSDPADGDGTGDVLEALRRWRAEAEAAARQGIDAVRDSDLVWIARSQARTSEEIRAMLVDEAVPLVEDIVREIDRVLGGEDAPHPDTHRNGDGPGLGGTGRGAPSDPEPAAPSDPEPAEQSDPVDGLGPDEDRDFAPPDYGAAAGPTERVESRNGPGGVVLTWPELPNPDGVVVYRVGSGDGFEPYSADAADQIAVTDRCRAVDDRAFTHAIRQVRVWAHSGATREEAAQNPPVLHGAATVVAPVLGVEIRQDEGRVVGRWEVLPGTELVQVLRVPIELAAREAGNPRFRILADQPNTSGFDDTGVERGRRYLYQLSAVAAVDGVRLMSAPVDRDIAVSAVLSAVPGLSVDLRPGPVAEVDVRWVPPPAGRVAVYRTQVSPEAGADREAMAEESLSQAGLPESALLLHLVAPEDGGRVAMHGVPWPQGWNQAWFTPVTLLDGRARLGPTYCVTRVGAVTSPRIVERTHKQVVTFGWPEGAAGVRMFRGVIDQDPSTATTGPFEEILHGQYERAGGMHLADVPLDSRGCSVHLVAFARFEGRLVAATPVSMNYPGLLGMRYGVTAKRTIAGRLTGLTLRIKSQMELTGPPAFVLVHNQDRLPMHIYDGHALPVRPAWDRAVPPAPRFVPPGLSPANPDLAWIADVRGLDGYVRLFVDVDDDRRLIVALIDPPVANLRLVPMARWRGQR